MNKNVLTQTKTCYAINCQKCSAPRANENLLIQFSNWNKQSLSNVKTDLICFVHKAAKPNSLGVNEFMKLNII